MGSHRLMPAPARSMQVTLWPAPSSRVFILYQHQPPRHAPWTKTKWRGAAGWSTGNDDAITLTFVSPIFWQMFITSSQQSLMLWVMDKRPYLISGAAVVGVVLSCIAHLQPYVGFSHVKAVGLFSEHRATANDCIDDWLRIWHISKQFLSIFVFISIFVSSISL